SNITAFYRKKFRKPIQEITVESIYYFFNSENDNDFVQLLYPPGGITALDSVTRNEVTINDRNYFSTRIDYVQPIGVAMRLETGVQFYLQNMDYNYTTNAELASNNYNYAELRNSAYASFYWKLKKFSLQSTLRAENSNIDINSAITSAYTTLLPSANLLYKFNTKHSLKLTYNRRIERPNLYMLNPFERLNNDLSVTSGNPYLKPEYKDRLQLSYTMNIKKVNFAPYIYHEFYSNKIGNLTTLKVTSVSDAQTVYSAPKNLLTGYEQGFGMNATIAFFNLNGSIYRGHFNAYSDSLTVIPSRDYYSFRLNSYVVKSLFKEKLNVFAFINYNGAVRSAQTITYSPLFYGVGLNQKIKNHSWGIFYLLPFSKTIQFSKVITETPIIYSENTQQFDASWFVQVMYSYKFNKGRAIKKSDRKSKIDSDTQGGGLGR
ncbi:MAG TPA: outer membrane beta-barrel family protein, partial [Bacteroidales bacterium]|nr:outer membrane beta-barrel family protein [Bacteroidales bacterium]